jgi:O-antigen/teichoic acid export membrane protein
MSVLGKIRNLTRHSAIYTVSTFIQRAQGLILLPIYTDSTYLSTRSEYGDYTLIYTFVAFMNVVYLYGIDSAFLRYFFLGKHKREDVYRTSIQLLTFTSVVTSGLILLFAEPLAELIFYAPGYVFFVRMAAVILFVDTLCNLPYLILRAEERSVMYSALRIGRFALELTLNFVFVVFMKLGVKGILYANITAATINLLVLLPFQMKYLKGSFNRDAMRQLLAFGIPMIPNGLAYLTVEVSDRYLMPRLLDKDTLGEYSANYRFGTLLLLLVTAFRTAWQPFFLKIANEPDARQTYARVLTYFVMAGSFIVVMGSYFVEYIVTFNYLPGKSLLGSEYWAGIAIIPLILVSYLLYGMYVNFTVGMYISKKSQWMIIFTGLAAIVNVSSNFYLMPNFGIMGAAVATVLAYVVMAGATFIANQKIYSIGYEYGRLAIVLAYLVISLILYYSFDMTVILRLVVLLLMVVLFMLMLRPDERSGLRTVLTQLKARRKHG